MKCWTLVAALLLVSAPAFAQPETAEEAPAPTAGEGPQLQVGNPATQRDRARLLQQPLQLRAPSPAAAAEEALDEAIEAGIADEEIFDDEEDWGEGWEDEPFEEAADEIGAEETHEEALVHGEGEELAGQEEHEAGHDAAASHEDAHEEAEHGLDPLTLTAQFVNFFMWLAIVVWLARKPTAEFLRNRRLSVEEGLVEAKELKDAAEEKYADYSERLERLDEELEKLRDEMVRTAEAEHDHIISEATTRAERMRKDTGFIIDQQLKQLRADLTREAIEAAIGAAQTVLEGQMKEADQTRLAKGYLDGLGATIEEEEARA